MNQKTLAGAFKLALAPLAFAGLSLMGCQKQPSAKDSALYDLFALISAAARNNNACTPGTTFPYSNEARSNIGRMVATTDTNSILVLDQDPNSGNVISTLNPLNANCSIMGGLGHLNSGSGDYIYYGCSASSSGVAGQIDLFGPGIVGANANASFASLTYSMNLTVDHVGKQVLLTNSYNSSMLLYQPDNAGAVIDSGALFVSISDIRLAQLDSRYSSDKDANKATAYVSHTSGVEYTASGVFNAGTVDTTGLLTEMSGIVSADAWHDCSGKAQLLLAINNSGQLMAFRINSNGTVGTLSHTHLGTWSSGASSLTKLRIYGSKAFVIGDVIDGSNDGVIVLDINEIMTGSATLNNVANITHASLATPSDMWINASSGRLYVSNASSLDITVIDANTNLVIGNKAVGSYTQRLAGVRQ